MINFILNDELISAKCAPEETVLDFIRNHKHLKGTKIGCREGDCGACTVMVGAQKSGKMEYSTATSCLMPLGNVTNKHIVTIEGISLKSPELSLIQSCMVDNNGSQCGFCTPGFIMSLTCFAISDEEKSLLNAVKSIDGNICRCTGYKSIERAANQLSTSLEKNNIYPKDNIYSFKVVPPYFNSIYKRLEELSQKEILNQPDSDLTTIGGGTDLFVHHRHELLESKANFKGLYNSVFEIKKENEFILLDGKTTVTQFLKNPLIRSIFPDLDNHIKLVSSTPIRNMATLAGNFVNASPIGDMTIFFLGLQADILLENANENWMPLCELYLGYKSLKKGKNELLLSIRFRKPSVSSFFNFEKVSKRTHLDIASVTSACSLTFENKRISKAVISMGGVGPIPMILNNTSSFIIDLTLPLGDEQYKELNDVLQTEIKPISDIRGSEKYKRLLAFQLIKAHFIEIQKKYAQH